MYLQVPKYGCRREPQREAEITNEDFSRFRSTSSDHRDGRSTCKAARARGGYTFDAPRGASPGDRSTRARRPRESSRARCRSCASRSTHAAARALRTALYLPAQGRHPAVEPPANRFPRSRRSPEPPATPRAFNTRPSRFKATCARSRGSFPLRAPTTEAAARIAPPRARVIAADPRVPPAPAPTPPRVPPPRGSTQRARWGRATLYIARTGERPPA